jgi:hypothetical protein
VVIATSGCWFALVRGPSEYEPPTQKPDCMEVPSIPIIDALASVIFVAAGISALASGGYDGGQSVDIGINVGFPLLVVGAVEGVSSVYGFVKVMRCRDAVRDYQARAGTRVP